MLDILFQHFSINFIPVVVAALLVFQVARLYVKQWQARRAAAALGATPLPVGIPGPLGKSGNCLNIISLTTNEHDRIWLLL